jgi:uncharacterized protein YecE (DUF72 family)
MGGEIRIGISGWRYAPWRGVFYPEDLPQREELHYASRQLRTIEINGSFYSLQRPDYYARWRDETPEDFAFSVKGGRYITHLLRLKEIEVPLANFFASGVLALNQKLGPFLWQLPPMLPFKSERLATFFKLLPRDTASAARLAEQHTLKKGRALARTDAKRPLRHALEVRHKSFATPEFIALLREHGIGLVVADTAGKWPFMEDVTSDFVYVRLHGDEELYVSGYTPEALASWTKKIAAWAAGREARGVKRIAGVAPKADSRDVFVYFDNDVKVRAPYDAMSLAHRLRLGAKPATPPDIKADVRPLLAAARQRWPGYGRNQPRQQRVATRASGARSRRAATRAK